LIEHCLTSPVSTNTVGYRLLATEILTNRPTAVAT